jgi:hypothetical protein
MRPPWFVLPVGLLLICSGVLQASPRWEKALWIEVKKHGDNETTIAITEAIARELIESDERGVHLAKKGEKDVITREMLKAVLDGKEESVEAQDKDGSEVTLHMADLKVPGRDGKQEKLIFEVYKSGSQTLRIALPEVEIEASNEEEDGVGNIETSIGWKGLLPFLAKEGGAVYINSVKDDTEIWLYVE